MRMKHLGVVCLLVACFIVMLGLLFSALRTRILNRQVILFEVYYSNPLGGYAEGIYIDAEGKISGFTSASIPRLFRLLGGDRGDPPYTGSQLFRLYGWTSKQIGTIESDELREMKTLIQKASLGETERRDTGLRDAGGIFYKAYLYDSEAKTHMPVRLYTIGDLEIKNLSEEGKALFEWLDGIYTQSEYAQGLNLLRSVRESE